MAEAIKKIASFSEDAIYNAILNQPLRPETLHDLESLASSLNKPTSIKEPVVERKLTNVEIFKAKIAPEIRSRVTAFRRVGHDLVLRTLKPMEDPSKMSLAEIVKTMKDIMLLEEQMEASLLISRYYRGILFIAAHRHIHSHAEFKKWLFDSFNVSYSTARRYMSVALLLKTYPMLVAGNISFGILQTYNKLIREEFKDDSGMKEHLTVVDERGNFICEINQQNVTILQDPIRFEADFRFRDLDSLDKSELRVFQQLTITKRQTGLESLCENPSEDAMLETD